MKVRISCENAEEFELKCLFINVFIHIVTTLLSVQHIAQLLKVNEYNKVNNS